MSAKFQIISFEIDHIEAVASLLVARHQTTCQAYPFLSDLSPEKAKIAIQAVWDKPHTIGVVAIEHEVIVGYLFGTEVFSDLRGRTAWVYQPGYALENGQSTELYRHLYAELARTWVEHGIFNHYTLILAHDRNLLDTWFSLGFAHQQAHGVLSLRDYAPTKLIPDNITIRQIQHGDEAILRELSITNAGYQTQSPVFAPAPPEYILELQDGYVGLLEDEDCTMWLAERDGQVLGYQAYFTVEPDITDLTQPNNCIELGIAGTKPDARGSGIGSALTQHGLTYMKEKGYDYCIADWRVTNLLSSRFWESSIGFAPVIYRLERLIDPRISWAST